MTLIRSLSTAGLCALLAACSAPEEARWQGYIEAEYRYLSSTGSGELSELYVQRGQHVEAGTLLFAIDARSEQQDLARLQAQLIQQQAVIANLQQGQRPAELAILRAQLEQARSAEQQSSAQWRRVKAMQEKQLLSQEQVDLAQANATRDRQRLQEMQARVNAAQLGARAREIDAAKASEKALQAQFEQAQWRLQQKQVKAPVAGLIHDTLYQAGEVVPAARPVAILLPEQATKIRFFVAEAGHGSLRTGQQLIVTCDGCGEDIQAEIRYIGNQSEYTPPVLFNRDNRSELMFRVEAWPLQARALPIGQPVDVRAARAQP